MTARPVGPGRAAWLADSAATGHSLAARALIASTDDALAVLARPCSPEEHADALATVRTALAFSEAWASRAQRRLDEERRRGAALVAAVRAAVEAPAGGCNDAGVRGVLSAALAAYEGSAEA